MHSFSTPGSLNLFIELLVYSGQSNNISQRLMASEKTDGALRVLKQWSSQSAPISFFWIPEALLILSFFSDLRFPGIHWNPCVLRALKNRGGVKTFWPGLASSEKNQLSLGRETINLLEKLGNGGGQVQYSIKLHCTVHTHITYF